MSSTFSKWFIPGAVTVLGGTIIALSLTTSPIARDLESRSVASLRDQNIDWASLTIAGRDAILTGTATTQDMIDDAVRVVASVDGVRHVDPQVVLAEFVSPFPFAARLDAGKIVLSGGYTSDATHAAILSAAPGATDTTRLLSGGPQDSRFGVAAQFALASLAHLDQGEASLADLRLTLTGRAKSQESYGSLEALPNALPEGVQLAALTISPPLASPYVWTARFDGTKLEIAGNIPDAALEAELRSTAPAGGAVSTGLVPSSGEPAGFGDNALILLKTLLLLEGGTASIEDGKIVLAGAPGSPAISDEVKTAIAAIGGTATLDPPRVADFALTVAKADGALTFTGFLPDAATQDRIGRLPKADITATQLGRGAPDRFASGLDFGLDLLNSLSEGRFEISGTNLQLSGRAASLTEFRALGQKVEEGAPQGFTLAEAQIRPPVASPFSFKAVKERGGATSLSGFLPADDTPATLHALIPALAEDKTNPADGAPDNFGFRAAKALEVLALLDSGSAGFDGATWSIEGIVDTPRKGFAADAAFSEAGLRTMGFRYDVRQPSLPVISPYSWRAQKTADGAVSVTGFSPHETFKSELQALIPDARDSSALGAGAPADFDTSAKAGLEALLALSEGSLGLNGSLWTLTGEVPDSASRDSVQTALSAQVDTSNWRIAVQALDAAPIVTPYLWSATKSSDGTIDLAGYAPTETLKADAATGAGQVGRDTTAIATGEPAGFAEDVAAGLDALFHLVDGKAAFDGSRWVLTGTAATQEQGEAATAALLQGSRGGSSWTMSITGYTAPSPIAEAPASSEPPAPEATSAEPVPVEPSSAEVAASSEAPQMDASSSSVPAEPVTSEPTSLEPVAAEATAEPEEDRSLVVVDPLPARFTFEASKESGQPIAMQGVVLREATIPYFGEIAGGAATDSLVVSEGLPANFVASGAMGLRALTQANEGRLGFDGARWWLRGMVENAESRDAITASIATLPDGKDWSVFIGILTPLEICRERVVALERLNAITFQSGSATLTDSSRPILDELAVDLNICPEASVHVEGHTDSDGAEDLNLALSVSRAEAVVEALIERGIAIERLYAEGFGESQPIADNTTREGKARNRRIVFSISME